MPERGEAVDDLLEVGLERLRGLALVLREGLRGERPEVPDLLREFVAPVEEVAPPEEHALQLPLLVRRRVLCLRDGLPRLRLALRKRRETLHDGRQLRERKKAGKNGSYVLNIPQGYPYPLKEL